jgi:hypothetical protein
VLIVCLICGDELIEALFISLADSCAGLAGTRPVSHITVATALPITSLCSHPLVGLRKHSVSIDERKEVQFFSHGSMTHLCFIPNSMSDAILPDCSSVTQQQDLQPMGGKVQPLLTYQQHPHYFQSALVDFGFLLVYEY